MEKGGKGEWDQKMSRFGGKVRTEKTLADKIAPAWNEKKGQGEEKARSEGKASGEERSRGRERVSKENGRGSTRGRGEGQAQEGPLSEDRGKRRINKGRVEEQGQLQERGRGKEGKPTQEQAPGEKQGRGQGKGRGVEKVWAQEPEKGEARYRTRYQGRARVRRKRRCEEKWGDGARGGGGARCRCKCKCTTRESSRTGENRCGTAKARNRNRDPVKSRGGMQSRGGAENKFESRCTLPPAMYPAGPAWPKLRVLRALWALLAVLLASWRLWAIQDVQECTWQVVLNKFETVGKNGMSDRFFDQEPLETVDNVFSPLVDVPTDQGEKYLSFPYYLKINYSCNGESSEAQVRKGHLTGLKPVVLVTFQSPVNFHQWKIEQLQIQMEAAPFRSKAEQCTAEEVCVMSWYTPMPIKNGSVVMRVDVSSNGLGPFIPNKRFQVNINGFLQRQQDNTLHFTVGNEIFNLIPRYFMNVPSRALWHTVDQAPVLILGGIPDEKSVLLTDTSFTDFFLVELNIDSCWVGSFYCPQASFTATIYDAIATESTLFIRQNQLVYYFTGTYLTLHESNRGSGSWVRVLANECIKRLCPVHFHSNGSEYIMALTTGKREGYVHFGTITDGRVSFKLLPKQRSVCEGIQVDNCSITWAVFIAGDYILMMLVEIQDPTTRKYFQVVSYDLVSDNLVIVYTIPEFIPDARGLEFLMILGTESYTNFPMVPKGMFYNPYNNLLFIWGNFLLQSYNNENFIYLVDFPKEQSIKYLVNSFHGDMAIVTETEEIWYLLEGSYRMYKLFPSKAWEVYVSLQVMHQSSFYTPSETMVTLFYEDRKLYQLVYLMNNKQGRLVKRLVPVEQLLMYQQLGNHYLLQRRGNHLTLSFTNFCPFTVMRLRDLPNPQIYTRQERYQAHPPRVLEPSGFHDENSLAVYQGLVYYLLCLHSKYHKPYADPVHDSTWRWWKNKKLDQDYYFYLASNLQSASNVYIDMASYEKIYDLKAKHELPERIFLDKGTSYRFSVFLTVRGHSFQFRPERVLTTIELSSKVELGVVLADPGCIEAVVKQKVLINRNSVLFWVTLNDKRSCFDQGLSGHHLMKTSMLVKVVGAVGHCFQNTHQGPRMQGNLMVPVLIGCPPGKRLAFDITYTLEYNRLQNKHYFDCVHIDPEMPCFLFRDIFYPFFLIQDLVTGDSGSFQGSQCTCTSAPGSYVLKVVGGGPTMDTIKEYSEEEIYRFNSPLDKTNSLIWTTKNTTTTKDSAFNIMTHQSLGIEWLCLENSPCHDTIPHTIFAPEFFFKVLVSNRGVDKSTYCDHQLIFLLHIHGLPLSAKRALLILMVSSSVFIGLVILYIIFCLLLPVMVKACNILRWKINNILTSESYYTYTSSSRVFSGTSGTKSRGSSSVSSSVSSKVAEGNQEAPEETSKKQSIT
ncbi:cation channel sperm-associated protein subunit gamma isoform X5 [Zalophus californianus]|uniref:Cation channel sperm-associated protein subunit gamma isoform X5 n=1 Tax=Zalophus californianus TaxID=9704 RepID=A0A6J2F8I5_ZALCA|nr:cation channel sperm-associated protein subunit gamma isoform X5 [Zalophus californianus]